MGKVRISNDLKKKLEKIGQEKAKGLAIDARERLTKEYLRVVDLFYNETPTGYSDFPKYYRRVGGLTKSFQKYYRNSHGTIYQGGIQLSENGIDISGYPTKNYNMQQKRELAFEHFLDGYHGLDIPSNIEPYKYMLKYRDKLIKEYKTRNGVK